MSTQIVMDRSGDTRHAFDSNDHAELALAEKRFLELTGAGFTAAAQGLASPGLSKFRSDRG